MSESANDMPSAPTALALKDTSPAQAPAKPLDAEPKQRISGKIAVAIDAMVWDGLPRAEAAAKAGISEHGLYKAFRKPPVKAAYLRELDVLRTSERARNIRRLIDMREQDENKMAVITAVKALEQISDDPAVNRGNSAAPGMIIVINGSGPVTTQTHVPDTKTIEHE